MSMMKILKIKILLLKEVINLNLIVINLKFKVRAKEVRDLKDLNYPKNQSQLQSQ